MGWIKRLFGCDDDVIEETLPSQRLPAPTPPPPPPPRSPGRPCEPCDEFSPTLSLSDVELGDFLLEPRGGKSNPLAKPLYRFLGDDDDDFDPSSRNVAEAKRLIAMAAENPVVRTVPAEHYVTLLEALSRDENYEDEHIGNFVTATLPVVVHPGATARDLQAAQEKERNRDR